MLFNNFQTSKTHSFSCVRKISSKNKKGHELTIFKISMLGDEFNYIVTCAIFSRLDTKSVGHWSFWI